jgi:hypothetical protein
MGKIFETGEGIQAIRWDLSLNVGLIEDIKEKSGVDLDLLIQKPEEFSQLLMVQPKKLVELLWCICEEQALKQSIDPRTFGRMFNREVLDSAGNALIESILDFYPRSSAGRAIRNNLPRILKQMDEEIETKVNRELDRVLSNKLTDTGESSELLQAKLGGVPYGS